ncbi:MAG: hypothetical protein PHQ43_11330 [Dehalococcoidales bacterium]|nr:hypothetical protein [Dehalococcoidales bacterium]
MKLRDAQDFIRTHNCGCGCALSYRPDGQGEHTIICPGNPDHTSFVRIASPMESYRRGDMLHPAVVNNIERKGVNRMTTTAVVLSEQHRQAITKHLKSFQATLAVSEIDRALKLAQYGFDPYLHLVVYQGKITTTIDGMYWWLRVKTGHRGVRLVSEPIRGDEDREIYGIGPNEIGVMVKAIDDKANVLASALGRASKDSKAPVIRGSAVESQHPFRMAEKRAEAQVIRKIAPIGEELLITEEVNAEGEATISLPEPKVIEVVDESPSEEPTVVDGLPELPDDTEPEAPIVPIVVSDAQFRHVAKQCGYPSKAAMLDLKASIGPSFPSERNDVLDLMFAKAIEEGRIDAQAVTHWAELMLQV